VTKLPVLLRKEIISSAMLLYRSTAVRGCVARRMIPVRCDVVGVFWYLSSSLVILLSVVHMLTIHVVTH
jgi:hypothetical protein